jgi:hypothetical protein
MIDVNPVVRLKRKELSKAFAFVRRAILTSRMAILKRDLGQSAGPSPADNAKFAHNNARAEVSQRVA